MSSGAAAVTVTHRLWRQLRSFKTRDNDEKQNKKQQMCRSRSSVKSELTDVMCVFLDSLRLAHHESSPSPAVVSSETESCPA